MGTFDRIKKKETFKSYEAGGGGLYIPFLGDILPKLFSHEPREFIKYYVITSTTKYRVKEDVYNKLEVGDRFNPKDSYFS